MKKISSKLFFTFFVSFLTWNLGWVINSFLIGNTPTQNKTIISLQIITWIIFLLIAFLIIFIKTRRLDINYKKINKISDKELKNLSEKTLNLPFFITGLYLIIFFFSSIFIYLIYRFAGCSLFYTLSPTFLALTGLIGITPIALFLSEYILQKINNEISIKVFERKIVTNPIKISSGIKSLFAFSSEVVGMIILIITLIYYYSINSNVKMTLNNLQNQQEFIVKSNSDVFKSELNIDSLKSILSENYIDKNIVILIADKNANFIYKSKEINIYNNIDSAKLTHILTKQLKSTFLENKTNYLISNVPINDSYNLLFASNVKNITKWYVNFLFWSFIAILVGFSVILQVVIFYNKSSIFSLKKLSGLLLSVSKGDFSEFAGKTTNDEIGEMLDSYNILVSNLSKTIKQIDISSEQVNNASIQLNTASQEISVRATEQASTIEEIAASMSQILTMIESNTINAEETGAISEKAAQEMSFSKEIFTKTINSVSQISDDISIISEIADKTDILSINAAIEAARAGEIGKGFSVVAKEIRNLADKTKKASEKINEISEDGKEISNLASEKLEKMLPNIFKSAELVKNIVDASREQRDGAENINSTIQQITEISNNNSASAEEMSASAEELSAQAEQLKSLISVFKIDRQE